ncbi:uncharacterized protein LOC144802337 [Lissotriton helveticus]
MANVNGLTSWIAEKPRVPLWKLRPETLEDPLFGEALAEGVALYFTDNEGTVDSRATEWDAFKVVVRGICIKDYVGVRKVLLGDLAKADAKLREAERGRPGHPELQETLCSAREAVAVEVERLRAFDYKRYVLRSHVAGDKAGTLLAWLSNPTRRCAPILQLKDKAGVIQHTQLGIVAGFQEYYEGLYKSTPGDRRGLVEPFLADLPLHRLEAEQAKDLGSDIDAGEIRSAVRRMARNKAPEIDGLPIEFYSKYLDVLAPRLLTVYKEAKATGRLPQSMREALVVPLLKPGREGNDPASYRPLSMLTADYKILSSILAARLLPHMTGLVHDDQNGFIPKRNTTVNIRRLVRLMNGLDGGAGTELVLSVDIEKAFDSLEWDYLYVVMERFGLGAGYIHWTKVLYAGAMARVSAYEKGEIWVDIARAVRSEGGPRRRLRNIKKRWQDIRCWSRRIARVQLKLEAPRRHGGSRQLTPNMLRVLEVVFPDLHRQLQEGQQHEGASSSESGGDRGADQAEGHTDSATCWEVSEGGSGTEWEESLQAARHVTDTSYHADESETDSQEGGEYAAMVTHTSLAALPSSSPISNLPLLGVPRVRASPRVSFVPGTAAPAPVSPAALSAETVDLLRQIAVGQASMLSVLHGHTQLITQVVSFMEGMSSAMSDLRRSVAAIESTLTAAMYTQQHLSPPHPSEPSTSASHIPTQHTRTRHRSDTPSAHTQHKKLKAPRTQSQGQVGTPTGRGETPHTHIHTPSRTDSQPCTSTPNVSPGSGGSFSALAEVCSQVFESTFGDAPTSVDESTTPAPTPPVLPSPVHAVPEDSTDGAPIVSTAD